MWSTAAILESANVSIAHNSESIDKELRPTESEGGAILLTLYLPLQGGQVASCGGCQELILCLPPRTPLNAYPIAVTTSAQR